jgi:hypothetical protein
MDLIEAEPCARQVIGCAIEVHKTLRPGLIDHAKQPANLPTAQGQYSCQHILVSGLCVSASSAINLPAANTAQPLAATKPRYRGGGDLPNELPDHIVTGQRSASRQTHFSPRATEEGKAADDRRAPSEWSASAVRFGRLSRWTSVALPSSVALGEKPCWLPLTRWQGVADYHFACSPFERLPGTSQARTKANRSQRSRQSD